MKLKKGFLTHETGGTQILVATSGEAFSGLVRSNRTAAFIVERLKAETTEADIVAAILRKYDAPPEQVKEDVARILETLRGIGALDE